LKIWLLNKFKKKRYPSILKILKRHQRSKLKRKYRKRIYCNLIENEKIFKKRRNLYLIILYLYFFKIEKKIKLTQKI